MARGTLPFVLVLVLIASYFGLADPYERAGENLLPHSDFDDPVWERGMPPGWRGLGALSRWGAALGVDGSGGLELRAGARRGGRVEWILDEPTRFEHLRVRGRLRVEDVEPGRRAWHRARLVFFCRDPGGRSRWDVPHTVAYLEGTAGWRHYEATFPVPQQVETGHLVLQQAGRGGRLFADDLELVPMTLAASAEPIRVALLIAWVASFLVALASLAPWRRHGGLVVTALVMLIVVGVSAPAGSFEELARGPSRLIDALVSHGSSPSGAADPAPEPPRAERPAPPEGPAKQPGVPGARPEPGPAAERGSAGPEPSTARADPLELSDAVRDLKKSGHGVLFALLGLSATLSYAGRRSPLTLSLLATALLVFAASTELLQFMIAKRQPTWMDLGVDALGLAAGIAMAGVLLVVFARKKKGETARASP